MCYEPFPRKGGFSELLIHIIVNFIDPFNQVGARLEADRHRGEGLCVMIATVGTRYNYSKRFVECANAFLFVLGGGRGRTETHNVHRRPKARTPHFGPYAIGWKLTRHSSGEGGGFCVQV